MGAKKKMQIFLRLHEIHLDAVARLKSAQISSNEAGLRPPDGSIVNRRRR